ncbi:calcium-independent phospholipase [Mycena amicta]|nr:calcium-independent phospholipase [Mycena amicta]
MQARSKAWMVPRRPTCYRPTAIRRQTVELPRRSSSFSLPLDQRKPRTSTTAYLPAATHPNGGRLLSLDGGGIKGISMLMMLDEIMKRIQRKTGAKELPRPADYFELAAGTSTGGIIALLLFRFRMTTTQALDEYRKIGKTVFSRNWGYVGLDRLGPVGGWIHSAKPLFRSAKFDHGPLEAAIDSVVERYGLDEEDKRMKGKALLARSGAAKMLVCTTAQNRAETVLFRSYPYDVTHTASIANDTMKAHRDEINISLAVRATSAAPTYFPEVNWHNLVFWDGALLNNNPIDQLWDARYDLVAPHEPPPRVSCILSLGCGYVKPPSPSASWFQLASTVGSVIGFVTNTNAKAKDFSRHVSRLKQRKEYEDMQYFRFNVNMTGNDIDLADYKRMGELEQMTEKYLKDDRQQVWIDGCVDALCA